MKGKVLVVDDEQPIRELLSVVLQRDYQVVEVESGAIRAVVTQEGPDTNPRWSPDKKWIAFDSTRDGAANLYIREVGVSGGTDKLVGPKSDVAKTLTDWSPDGKYLAFVRAPETPAPNAAPQIYMMSMSGGDSWQVTSIPRGVGGIGWSPDGKWIAYFSDESGEYALHLRQQSGMGEVKKINLGSPPSFFYAPTWAPDSKKIAFTDKRLNLWYVDIDKGTPINVDTSKRGFGFNASWSPDSRWIAYTKPVESWYSAVFIYSLEEAKSRQVTHGLSDASSAASVNNGKHLYFMASTDIGPKLSGFDMSSYPHQTTRSAYVVVLKKTDPSPLAPESDEEKDQPAAPPAGPRPPEKKEAVTVTVDFDQISQRIIALPIHDLCIIVVTDGRCPS